MGFSQDLEFFRASLRVVGVGTPWHTSGKSWRTESVHGSFHPKRAASKVWRFWSGESRISQPPFLNMQSQAWKTAFCCVLARNPAAETLLSKCRASLFIQISPQCLFKGEC